MQDSKQVTCALIELYKGNDWLMNLNFRALVRLSKIDLLSREVKLLDCGCAMGHFLRMLQKYGFTNVYGIDASQEIAENARVLTGGHIVYGDVLNMSELFGNAVFDVITALNLQHHLGHEEEWERFILQCRKVMKQGGVLFIREPYPTILFNILRWMTHHSLFFKIRFLQRRLQSLIEEKEPLYYFIDRWPGYYKECLKRNNFVIIKDFCWMGHRIVVSSLEGKK